MAAQALDDGPRLGGQNVDIAVDQATVAQEERTVLAKIGQVSGRAKSSL